jgi:hypothetical protein
MARKADEGIDQRTQVLQQRIIRIETASRKRFARVSVIPRPWFGQPIHLSEIESQGFAHIAQRQRDR